MFTVRVFSAKLVAQRNKQNNNNKKRNTMKKKNSSHRYFAPCGPSTIFSTYSNDSLLGLFPVSLERNILFCGFKKRNLS